MTTREDLAWAAGFFDGEGCISTLDKYHVVMTVSQRASNAEVIHKFRRIMGFGKVYGPYFSTKTSRDCGDVKYHATRFEHVQAAVAMMWPWLGTAKRRQYAKAFRLVFSFVRRRGGNHTVMRAEREARARGEVLYVVVHARQLLHKHSMSRTSKLIFPPKAVSA